MSLGPTYFTPGMLVDGIFLNGEQFHNGRLYPITNWSQDLGPSMMEVEGGGTIIQNRWSGGPSPMNVVPLQIGMSMSILTEADYFTILGYASRQLAVPLWFDLELPDHWYIPGRQSPSQTAWFGSRLSPWTLPGITFVTKPPRVFLDQVEQTVISAGVPSAGEVKIAETEADDEVFQAALRPQIVVITPANLDGRFLELRCRPQIMATIHNPQHDYSIHNDLRVSFEVREHLSGIYHG